MNLQVTSTCEAHKTLEGLQKSEMTCWKKGEMARGRCGRRDLVLFMCLCSNYYILLYLFILLLHTKYFIFSYVVTLNGCLSTVRPFVPHLRGRLGGSGATSGPGGRGKI